MTRARTHAFAVDLDPLAERLRRKAHRLTAPRQALLDLLRRQAHPLSIKDLFAALPKGRCDLATVYRSMNLLERLGIVQRFELGDGVARFELVAEGDAGHHHHLVCTRCAEIVELEECPMEDLEARIASRNGFKRITHKLEFFGICPQCQ